MNKISIYYLLYIKKLRKIKKNIYINCNNNSNNKSVSNNTNN